MPFITRNNVLTYVRPLNIDFPYDRRSPYDNIVGASDEINDVLKVLRYFSLHYSVTEVINTLDTEGKSQDDILLLLAQARYLYFFPGIERIAQLRGSPAYQVIDNLQYLSDVGNDHCAAGNIVTFGDTLRDVFFISYRDWHTLAEEHENEQSLKCEGSYDYWIFPLYSYRRDIPIDNGIATVCDSAYSLPERSYMAISRTCRDMEAQPSCRASVFSGPVLSGDIQVALHKCTFMMLDHVEDDDDEELETIRKDFKFAIIFTSEANKKFAKYRQTLLFLETKLKYSPKRLSDAYFRDWNVLCQADREGLISVFVGEEKEKMKAEAVFSKFEKLCIQAGLSNDVAANENHAFERLTGKALTFLETYSAIETSKEAAQVRAIEAKVSEKLAEQVKLETQIARLKVEYANILSNITTKRTTINRLTDVAKNPNGTLPEVAIAKIRETIENLTKETILLEEQKEKPFDGSSIEKEISNIQDNLIPAFNAKLEKAKEALKEKIVEIEKGSEAVDYNTIFRDSYGFEIIDVLYTCQALTTAYENKWLKPEYSGTYTRYSITNARSHQVPKCFSINTIPELGYYAMAKKPLTMQDYLNPEGLKNLGKLTGSVPICSSMIMRTNRPYILKEVDKRAPNIIAGPWDIIIEGSDIYLRPIDSKFIGGMTENASNFFPHPHTPGLALNSGQADSLVGVIRQFQRGCAGELAISIRNWHENGDVTTMALAAWSWLSSFWISDSWGQKGKLYFQKETEYDIYLKQQAQLQALKILQEREAQERETQEKQTENLPEDQPPEELVYEPL